MGVTDQELVKILTENKFLEEEKLKRAQANSLEKKISLAESILEQDFLTDDQLGQIIADQKKLHFIRLSKEAISKEVLYIIPETFAQKNKIIAFAVDKEHLKLASYNVISDDLIEIIEKKSGLKVEVFYATERDIEDSLSLYKKQIQSKLDDLLNPKLKDAPIEQIVDSIIENAYDTKASDVHIEPRKEDSVVRLRIDGVLHDVLKIPKTLHEQVITKIKVDSRLRTDEHMAAQDGKMQKKVTQEEIDIRVSIVPIVNGEACVLRLLTSHYRQLGLPDLGMNPRDLKAVEEAFLKPYGMILSTGPTGSGKTTTMYAILKILNTREKNITTIEDPVEYNIEGINQIQVNPKTNLTFADGLKSILRQDPDIVYVGEIRDNETAGIAVNAAMTGHLVLSTLHTNDAATSLPRLIDMGIEPFLVSSTVNIIIAQRLVRKICEKCKVSYTVDSEKLTSHFSKEIITKVFPKKPGLRFYKGKGCPVCHQTGYIGRVGIFEVLIMSPAIQELINKKADSSEISKKAVEEGMVTMIVDGLIKASQGETSIEEVLRVTKE